MKRVTILVVILITVLNNGYAQNFYFRGGLGFTVPQAGQMNDGNGTPYNGTMSNTPNTQTYKVQNASFSAGIPLTLALGYMFTKNVGMEIAASYNIGVSEYTFKATNVVIGGIASDYSLIQKANGPTFVTPSLVLQSDAKKLNVYTRFGIVLPLNTTVTQDQVITNLPGTGVITTDDFTFEIKTSFSLGFAAAAGLKYKINNRMSFWGELGFMSLSVLTKQGNLIAASSNGQLIDLSYVQGTKTINYSKNAVVDSIGAQQPAYALPFSNVGIHVGLSFDLQQGAKSGRGRNDVGERRKKF